MGSHFYSWDPFLIMGQFDKSRRLGSEWQYDRVAIRAAIVDGIRGEAGTAHHTRFSYLEQHFISPKPVTLLGKAFLLFSMQTFHQTPSPFVLINCCWMRLVAPRLLQQVSRLWGASQTKGFHPLLDVFSLASTGFLEHLTMPTDGALSTKCLQTPCQ